MGFFGDIISATVKTALTPIAIVKDATEVVIGGEANNTKKLIESAGEDLSDSIDHLEDGRII